MKPTNTMPQLPEADTAQQTPAKDPIVDRVYDYTKWHIALYGAVLGVLAGGLALGKTLPTFLLVPLVCLAVAGIAAGTLASCLSRREHWKGFLETKTFPLVPDSKNVGLTMQCWMNIQHAGIWAAILWGVVGAIVLSLKAKPSTPEPPPSATVAPTTPNPK